MNRIKRIVCAGNDHVEHRVLVRAIGFNACEFSVRSRDLIEIPRDDLLEGMKGMKAYLAFFVKLESIYKSDAGTIRSMCNVDES